jgi:hypothetical protein
MEGEVKQRKATLKNILFGEIPLPGDQTVGSAGT